MRYLSITCQAAMVAVFATSLVSKLRGRAAWTDFADSVRRIGSLRGRAVAMVAGAVVAMESAALLLVATPATAPTGMAFSGGLLLGFTVVVMAARWRGVNVACRCFGAGRIPIGRRHGLRNLLMAAVAWLGWWAATAAASRPAELAGILVAVAAGVLAAAVLILFDELIEVFVAPAPDARAVGERSG